VAYYKFDVNGLSCGTY